MSLAGSPRSSPSAHRRELADWPRAGSKPSGISATVQTMTAASEPAGSTPASADDSASAQFGPHRFYPGEGGGSEQFREGLTAVDIRAIWDTLERLWAQADERAGRLSADALDQQVNEEWSYAQTLRHLVFITDAWASRTVRDEEMPYHPLGLPQSWYPAADATALGIDLTAHPGYAEIVAARADRMAVMRRIVDGLADDSLGRLCRRSPAPGYPDEERTVIDCIAVVMDEEIEHYRFAIRDLAVLEAS